MGGGRGEVSDSRVFCTLDDAYCESSRLRMSGSIESKLVSIPEALTLGVDVDSDELSPYGGQTYRVTFKDDSPSGSDNFKLEVETNSLLTLSNSSAFISVEELVTGVVYSPCFGTVEVPQDQALATGQYYYAKASCENEIGYSDSQISSSSAKPMVVPGRPTSVTLKSMSESDLMVSLNTPQFDGGDPVDKFEVQLSKFSDFTVIQTEYITLLTGGGPYQRKITGLEKGVDYYCRARALNTQGPGAFTISYPPKMNPHTFPGSPRVDLYVTSDKMLTVSFENPLDDGGDAVTYFVIEWDVSANFNSGGKEMPHKGSIQLDASLHNSWTFGDLSSTESYYVRVSCVNSAGKGPAAYAKSNPVQPKKVTAGKPVSVLVQSAGPGEIYISWERPYIPHHGKPCSGTASAPGQCPFAGGSSEPETTGGYDVQEYEIVWNENSNFNGHDGGRASTSLREFTIKGLIEGRTYWVKVLARNPVGSGIFCQYSGAYCDKDAVGANQLSAIASP